MLAFGHLGIGSAMGRPVTDKRQIKWLLVGTLLPDLIDKPLAVIFDPRFHGHSIFTTGVRSVGHSMMFLLFLLLVTLASRSRGLYALTIGVATHLGLDAVEGLINAGFDQFALVYGFSSSSSWTSSMVSQWGDGLHGGAEYICEFLGLLLIFAQFYVHMLSKSARRFRSRHDTRAAVASHSLSRFFNGESSLADSPNARVGNAGAESGRSLIEGQL